MDRLLYLQQVTEAGRKHMAPSIEEALAVTAYHGVDSFQGLYHDLAEMELAKEAKTTAPLRTYIMEKALDRIDQRLDCADFVIPALIRMLYAHRGTPRLPEELAAKIEHSLIGYKY